MLRENIPTWLDRCDLRQPHQVIGRSLYELIRGALRPRRLLAKLDVNGPLTPAWLMLVCGTLWLWLLTSVIVAVAIVVHESTSPAVALTAGALVWGLRLVTASLMLSLVLVAPVLTSWVHARAEADRSAAAFAWAPYLWPTIASCGCIPVAVGLCVEPELDPLLRIVWVVLPVLMCLPPARRHSFGLSGVSKAGAVTALVAWVLGFALAVGAWLVGALAGRTGTALAGVPALRAGASSVRGLIPVRR